MSDLGVPADPGEPESIERITAVLRAESADIDTLVRVLGSSLGDSLPAGMVEVQRVRSLADRFRGRAGVPVGVTVTTPEVRLQLSHGRHRDGVVGAEVQRTVRGVVISRQDVGVDVWIATLAQVLSRLATQSSDARQALSRLLES